MSKLPKLRVINPYWDVAEEIRDFERGKYLPFRATSIFIAVEGQVVHSYEELVRLATKDCHKDKEFLEVRYSEIIGGG